MNPEQEKELEKEISLVLRTLPDLAAPPGFLRRTMGALEKPATYGLRPWARWPMFARVAFLLFALAALGGAFAESRVVEPGVAAEVSRQVAPVAAGITCFCGVLSALAGALALAVEHLGLGFMLAGLAAAAGACAVCAGCGTIFVRLAWAAPEKRQI